MSIFKGMTKEQKKTYKNLIKVMDCDLDCDNCKKTQKECIHDTRFCVNLLLKERNKKLKKTKRKKIESDVMIT